MWERGDGLTKLCEKSDFIWRRSDEEERREGVTLSCMWHSPPMWVQPSNMYEFVSFCLVNFNFIRFLLILECQNVIHIHNNVLWD